MKRLTQKEDRHEHSKYNFQGSEHDYIHWPFLVQAPRMNTKTYHASKYRLKEAHNKWVTNGDLLRYAIYKGPALHRQYIDSAIYWGMK